MGRRPCCSKVGLNRGAWTNLEDKILKAYINAHGEGNWNSLPKLSGLKRCGKSCRLRWVNYLRPDIKRGNISQDEEELIIKMHKLLGNRWSLIAGRLPGRTDNEIKNYWNTNLRKKIEAPEYSTDDININPKTKPKRSKTANLEPNSNNDAESRRAVEPIRTKAFRYISRTQTVPKSFPFPSPTIGHDENQSQYLDGELMIKHDSTIDFKDQTAQEVAEGLIVDSCYCNDHPQMNGNMIRTSTTTAFDFSPPFDEHVGIDNWTMADSSNNLIDDFSIDEDFGLLDFESLACFLAFGHENV